MSWNYRIVERRDGSFGLHEVYYDASVSPTSITAEPIAFAVDAEEGAAGIIASLKMALQDAEQRPVLIEADTFGHSS